MAELTGAADRRFYFGTNFKMHQTPSETILFLDGLATILPRPRTQLFVLPPFTSLSDAARHPMREQLWLGAQNVHWADAGAHTGEISASMLTALGLDFVMIGHAERRAAGETDAMVGKKVSTALRHGLRVLLCVGESREERAAGAGIDASLRQLLLALHEATAEMVSRLVIAYEPVWAIGESGSPATLEQAAPVAEAIRRRLQEVFGTETPLLYGGSVDVVNAADFARGDAFDGLFVGRAAWTPAGFRNVLNAAERARFGN